MDDLDKNDLIRDDEEPDLEEEEYKIGDEFDDLDRDGQNTTHPRVCGL